jgi:hypothetical protein
MSSLLDPTLSFFLDEQVIAFIIDTTRSSSLSSMIFEIISNIEAKPAKI